MAFFISGTGGVPSYSWMVFVDGENFTIRGQTVARQNNLQLSEGKCYYTDTFLWLPSSNAHSQLGQGHLHLAPNPIRSFYYTSVWGDEEKINDVRKKLWECKFDPVVFKKVRRNEKAKGVDIALTKDLLTNAFHNNYDVAIIFAADSDYIPVIEEIRRMGKVVYLAFFNGDWIKDKLKVSCDSFVDITPTFIANWQKKS